MNATKAPNVMTCKAAAAAREIWESASPADPHHPALESRDLSAQHLRQSGGDLLIPLMRDPELTPTNDNDPLGNLIIISVGGDESTVAVEQRSRNPNQETRKIYPGTKYVAAVFGDPVTQDVGQVIGHECDYLGGGLAGASRVYLCVGWEVAAKLHHDTQHPAVGVRSEDELLEMAKSMRHNLPTEVAITVAATTPFLDEGISAGAEIGARVVRL